MFTSDNILAKAGLKIAATKLLNLFKTFGAKSSSSQIRTITSLMKSINGMQAGVTMRKQ